MSFAGATAGIFPGSSDSGVAAGRFLAFHPAPVEKTRLLEQIVALLDEELELYAKSARAAHEEATHEQSKAENKYDTRGLEASYLARGQSMQALETKEAREAFARLVPRDFSPEETIDLGALVELTMQPGDETALYFIGPKAGGTEVACDGKTVLVITPQSPLGRLLQGRRVGERVVLEGRRGKITYTIRSLR